MVTLYRYVKVENENLFLSPLSTYYALLAAYEGSEKVTKQEFENVLYLNASTPLNSDYLHNMTSKPDSCAVLKVSNAVWLDRNFIVEGEYSKSLSDKYFTNFERTNFSDTKKAILDINNWFSEHTNHTINEIVSESDIHPKTNFIISNAVYFKGEWLLKFNKKNTASAPFFSSSQNQYSVDFMNMTESIKYYETDDFQFISKPYRNSDLSFCILLPKNLFALEQIECKMNNCFLDEILDSTYYTKTALSIPKIKLESSYELSDALKKAGLKTAFTRHADFSGITKEEPIQLAQVLHKTWIEVDEEQTEAAAATAVVKIRGYTPQSYKVFKADHPFVFFVIDNETQSILFIGRYVKPMNSIKIEKESMIHNLDKRNHDKFEVGKATLEPLYIINEKIVSQVEFQKIDPNNITSIQVIKDKEKIVKYTNKNYDSAIIITLKN